MSAFDKMVELFTEMSIPFVTETEVTKMSEYKIIRTTDCDYAYYTRYYEDDYESCGIAVNFVFKFYSNGTFLCKYLENDE